MRVGVKSVPRPILLKIISLSLDADHATAAAMRRFGERAQTATAPLLQKRSVV